jgi:SlyX protein
MEIRLVEIEIKLSKQEKLIDELSSIIYEQQLKIDKLERVTKELSNANTFDIGLHNVKPPHY